MDDLLIRMMRWGQQGYNCSQILLLLALEERGESNPGLVRTMAGLAYGCGSGGATCGVLTGGCCALAYLAVPQTDESRASEQLPLLLQTLSEWFGERVAKDHGGMTCNAIVGDAGPAASKQTCGRIAADTYAKVLEILAENGMLP